MNAEKQREQLHKLLDIVIDGNGFEHRKREYTGTLPTLFFEFSGHVNDLSIRLCEDGWEPSAHYQEYNFYLDYDITDEKVETFRAVVNNVLTDKNPSDVMRRDIEKKEKDLAKAKKEIAEMKKALRKAKKKEGCA